MLFTLYTNPSHYLSTSVDDKYASEVERSPPHPYFIDGHKLLAKAPLSPHAQVDQPGCRAIFGNSDDKFRACWACICIRTDSLAGPRWCPCAGLRTPRPAGEIADFRTLLARQFAPTNFVVTAASRRAGRTFPGAYRCSSEESEETIEIYAVCSDSSRILRTLEQRIFPKALKKAEDAQAIYVSTFGKSERLRGYPGQRPTAAWGAGLAPHATRTGRAQRA